MLRRMTLTKMRIDIARQLAVQIRNQLFSKHDRAFFDYSDCICHHIVKSANVEFNH
jgi:hypothetical protein